MIRSGSGWSRRAFLKGGGVALFSLGISAPGPGFLRRLAAASEPTLGRPPVLVALFQRGAMDGLAAVPPLDAEGWLARLRPRLALPPTGDGRALELGGGFGLHPALADLLPLWRNGSLAVVHGVGSPDPTRSHFDAQDYLETGTPGVKSTASGWLNRVCGELGHEPSPLRAVALAQAVPRSLQGPEPAVAVRRLADLDGGVAGGGRVGAAGFEALYRETTEELLGRAARESREAAELVAEVTRRAPSRASFPASPLGRSLREISRIVRADVGLEVAFAECSGWDTHVYQGAADGSFAPRARDLAASLAAFWRDLGEHRGRVVVMTMTEFGRTVAENGSGGTDHGHGSCLFVLGGGVDGGRVHGALETLDPDGLHDGRDLPVTVDFRSVFAEVAARHMGVAAPEALFPGWEGARLRLWRDV